jgi:hypothetical protein
VSEKRWAAAAHRVDQKPTQEQHFVSVESTVLDASDN